MAHQIVYVNVGVTVKTPEFECEGMEAWNEQFHGKTGKALRQSIRDAVNEQVGNALPLVMVDGVEMEVTLGRDAHFDPNYGPHHDIILTEEEQAIFDAENAKKEEGWDTFHAEVDARMKRDGLNIGCYSMGDLWGSPEQLDEVVGEGPHAIIITDGWGDEEPVMSSVYSNPTKWDMFRLFSEALEKSQDHHHVFLEGLQQLGLWDVDGEKVMVYRALTGS